MKVLLTLAYQANRLYCYVFRPLQVSVKLILIREGQVLLVQHSYQRGWHLPGGGVKRGETLEQAARREAREELGASLDQLRFWGIYTNFKERKSDHLALFVSEAFSLAPQHRDIEIERVAFFPVDQLPNALGASSQRRVAEYLQGEESPRVALW